MDQTGPAKPKSCSSTMLLNRRIVPVSAHPSVHGSSLSGRHGPQRDQRLLSIKANGLNPPTLSNIMRQTVLTRHIDGYQGRF